MAEFLVVYALKTGERVKLARKFHGRECFNALDEAIMLAHDLSKDKRKSFEVYKLVRKKGEEKWKLVAKKYPKSGITWRKAS